MPPSRGYATRKTVWGAEAAGCCLQGPSPRVGAGAGPQIGDEQGSKAQSEWQSVQGGGLRGHHVWAQGDPLALGSCGPGFGRPCRGLGSGIQCANLPVLTWGGVQGGRALVCLSPVSGPQGAPSRRQPGLGSPLCLSLRPGPPASHPQGPLCATVTSTEGGSRQTSSTARPSPSRS